MPSRLTPHSGSRADHPPPPSYLGALISCISCGVLVTLAWLYWREFGLRDRPVFLGLAVAMFLLAAASTATLSHFGFDNLVAHYGDALYILKLNWAFPTMMGMIGVSCFLLNIFLSYRIWIASLGTWRVVPGVILSLSAAGGGLSLYLAGWYSQQATNLSLTTRPNIIWAWFATDTASEAIATLSLLWLVVIQPRRARPAAALGPHLPAHGILVRIVLRAVETNVLSLVFHILTMSLYGRSSSTSYSYTVPAFCLTNIYAINLFAQLLSRPAIVPQPASCWDSDFKSIKIVSEVAVEVSEPTAAQRARGAGAYERHFEGPSLWHQREGEDEKGEGSGHDLEMGLGAVETGKGQVNPPW